MPIFEFTIRLAGHGDTPAEAWENAANQFDLLDSQGPIPEHEIIEEDE